jgi:hypothetical protein
MVGIPRSGDTAVGLGNHGGEHTHAQVAGAETNASSSHKKMPTHPAGNYKILKEQKCYQQTPKHAEEGR